MNQPPLNPDALRAAFEAVQAIDGPASIGSMEVAEAAVSAYLAAAQPVVNSVEELDQLPVGSVVLDRFDYPHLKAMIALPEYLNLRTGARITRTEFYLPARVLYRPEVKP